VMFEFDSGCWGEWEALGDSAGGSGSFGIEESILEEEKELNEGVRSKRKG